MKKIIVLVLFTLGLNVALVAQKSKDGSKTISGTEIVNEYTNLTADAASGDQTISVANSAIFSTKRALFTW